MRGMHRTSDVRAHMCERSRSIVSEQSAASQAVGLRQWRGLFYPHQPQRMTSLELESSHKCTGAVLDRVARPMHELDGGDPDPQLMPASNVFSEGQRGALMHLCTGAGLSCTRVNGADK